MGDRNVQAGQTIRLRAKFKDDVGTATTASGVSVSIWEPDNDITDITQAFVVSGVPTLLGEGLYEYEFLSPDCGPMGSWHDVWTGQLSCQDLSSPFTFTVSTTNQVTPIDCQLANNNVVQVILPSGIQATDGSVLEDPFEFEFLTVTNPSYADLRKVRLEVGGFIPELLDDTIQTAILEASIEANVLTFAKTQLNSALFLHARREYTTCMASTMLLHNLGNLQLRSKTLGDLHVEYDTNGVRDMLARLVDCTDRWASQIMAGGGAKAASNPRMVVKGSRDPDRPAVARSWEGTDTGSARAQTPAANARARRVGQRRHLKTFWPRNTKGWW